MILDCGCHIYHAYHTFCPLHKNAPELLKSLKATVRALTDIKDFQESETIIKGIIEHLTGVISDADKSSLT